MFMEYVITRHVVVIADCFKFLIAASA